ncbi:MAG TPA: DUF58 domain-containing protein [Chitinophagaceae bacterium]|nr:DUF58 domain-containing protein [Chitinophagaceae bacterium]
MIRSFYLNRIAYYAALTASVFFALSYFIPVIFTIGLVLLSFLIIGILIDTILLYSKKKGIGAYRVTTNRFSNGDDNKVTIVLQNEYGFKILCKLIDELPFQFQNRNWKKLQSIDSGAEVNVDYFLKPQERGEYNFGNINVFVSSPLRLITRRYSFERKETIKVYPSYIQMRRYQLLATANRLQEVGVKRLRKLGHSMEFEQIKEYVLGDDYRTINWKATARHSNLMVNNYTDERSQQIYCIINKGRIMKMPFGGMTLLDYAVNASLVLLNIALMRQDKAGLITFAENLDAFVPADKKPGQLNLIIETLYKQETNFLEPDFEKLFSVIRNNITQRSLLVLFSNFESMESLQRELPSLKRMAHYHLLMVVFFENTELKKLTEASADTIEGIYIKTIAEKYAMEKKLMVKELRKAGIVAVLTTPENLTLNSINKYLELKNRQFI